MSTDPHDPHTPSAAQTGQTAPLPQTTSHSADCEETPDVEMSAEEEAALCARYEEEKNRWRTPKRSGAATGPKARCLLGDASGRETKRGQESGTFPGLCRSQAVNLL